MAHSVMFFPCKDRGWSVDPKHLSNKLGMAGQWVCNPRLEMCRHMDSWSALASQPRRINEFQIQWETRSQKQRSKVIEEDTNVYLWCLHTVHMVKHIYISTWSYTPHLHTHTITQRDTKISLSKCISNSIKESAKNGVTFRMQFPICTKML